MHPIMFTVPTPWGDVPIYSYGVMLGTSLFVAWYFIMYAGQRLMKFNKDFLANGFIISVISGIFGGRLLYVLTNLGDYPTIGSMLDFRSGGLVAYGGLITGSLAMAGYAHWRKVSLTSFLDVTAPTIGSGLCLTRVGCWLYGCDYGARLEASAPDWLKNLGTFPRWSESLGQGEGMAFETALYGSPAYNHHVTDYGLPIDAAASFPVHPTQIYEAVAGVIICAITLYVLFRKRTFPGRAAFTAIALYSVWRFLIEFVRDDLSRGAAFGFSTSQIISIGLLPVVGYFAFRMKRQVDEHGWPSWDPKSTAYVHGAKDGDDNPVRQAALASGAIVEESGEKEDVEGNTNDGADDSNEDDSSARNQDDDSSDIDEPKSNAAKSSQAKDLKSSSASKPKPSKKKSSKKKRKKR